MRADRAARAKSQLSSSSSPPAAVTPLTRAMAGIGARSEPAEHPVEVGHEAGEPRPGPAAAPGSSSGRRRR